MLKKILKWFLLIFTILSTMLFVWIEYLSPDARYMRDNALYVAQRMYAAKILKNEPSSFSYYISPLPINMNRLLVNVEGWTTGYIKAAIAANDTNVNNTEISGNPYDTLSRLELKANMEDTQAIYEDVIYCHGVCAPEFPLDGTTASSWSMNTENFQNAKNACSSEAKIFISLFLIMVCSAGFMFCEWSHFFSVIDVNEDDDSDELIDEETYDVKTQAEDEPQDKNSNEPQ